MEKCKKANKNSVQIKAGRYNKTILQSLALQYLTLHTFFIHIFYICLHTLHATYAFS